MDGSSFLVATTRLVFTMQLKLVCAIYDILQPIIHTDPNRGHRRQALVHNTVAKQHLHAKRKFEIVSINYLIGTTSPDLSDYIFRFCDDTLVKWLGNGAELVWRRAYHPWFVAFFLHYRFS